MGTYTPQLCLSIYTPAEEDLCPSEEELLKLLKKGRNISFLPVSYATPSVLAMKHSYGI